jgi:histidine triad (HIT) family protein
MTDVEENELVLAFHHTRPFWPVHVVVVPRRHVPSLVDLGGGRRACSTKCSRSCAASPRT